jgi:hypothetical protein
MSVNRSSLGIQQQLRREQGFHCPLQVEQSENEGDRETASTSDLALIRAGLTDPNRAVKMAAEAAVKRIESR